MGTHFLVFILLFVFIHIVNGYRILGVISVPSKSHYYVVHALLKGLAKEGHDVTLISPFKLQKPIKNYKEIYLENSWELWRRGIDKLEYYDV